jgi:hypothetical protein
MSHQLTYRSASMMHHIAWLSPQTRTKKFFRVKRASLFWPIVGYNSVNIYLFVLTLSKTLKVGAPGVNLTKLFWHKFTHTFCKLDYFLNMINICCHAWERSSLQKRVSKFSQKKFYEMGPSFQLKVEHLEPIFSFISFFDQSYKTFHGRSLPEWSTFKVFQSRVGSWPYPQTLD